MASWSVPEVPDGRWAPVTGCQVVSPACRYSRRDGDEGLCVRQITVIVVAGSSLHARWIWSGRALSLTSTVTGSSADRYPAADAVTVAVCVPAARPSASTVRVSVPGVVPDVGEIESQL